MIDPNDIVRQSLTDSGFKAIKDFYNNMIKGGFTMSEASLIIASYIYLGVKDTIDSIKKPEEKK